MATTSRTVRLTAGDLADLDLTDHETIAGGEATVIDRLLGQAVRLELVDGATLTGLATAFRALADQADVQAAELRDAARVSCGGGCGTLIQPDDDCCGDRICARRVAAEMMADRLEGARV